MPSLGLQAQIPHFFPSSRACKPSLLQAKLRRCGVSLDLTKDQLVQHSPRHQTHFFRSSAYISLFLFLVRGMLRQVSCPEADRKFSNHDQSL